MARSIGADHVIDYTQEDFSRNGRRYDLILAVNGNHALRDYTRALSPGETAVVLGGSIPQFLQGVVLATWDIRSSTRSTWECMRCMRSREEDSLVERDVIRACCQWQPQLSKKRDFFPSIVPHEHVPYSLRNRDQGERNKTCPRLLSGPGHDRGTDRNRRVSVPLSPIFYLFLAPAGKLYLKVQHLLAADETAQSSNPPLLKHRRPGPKHPNYGIPAEHWAMVIHRVVEQKEPLRAVAAAYGVSHETIRRLIRAATKEHVPQEAQRSNLS